MFRRLGNPGLILAVALAGCDQQSFFTTSPEILPVAVLCESGATQTKVVEVVFPEPEDDCKWNQGGNGGRTDEFVSARIDQVQQILPAGSVVCGLGVESDPQFMQYDDELILHLNGFILMASWDYTDRFAREGGLPVYAWAALKGAPNDRKLRPEVPFCLGRETGETDCSIPATEATGTLELNLGDAVIQNVMENIRKRPAQEPLTLTLVTTGDNEDGDCTHRDLRLSVSVKYLEAP